MGEYDIEELRVIVDLLGRIFDLVRVVDPIDTAVVDIQPDGTTLRRRYTCFRVWDRSVRCDNCTSICALNTGIIASKYEFRSGGVFHVVSQPVRLRLAGGETALCALELASRIDGRTELDEKGVFEAQSVIEDVQRKAYTDALTSVFNRRFYDEMLFLSRGINKVPQKVALILLDMFGFKDINDRFGHAEGDRILREVASALKGQIRSTDSVMRYGGDEFVVVLVNCEEIQVEPAVERLSRAVSAVMFADGTPASADFGYSYSPEFIRNSDYILSCFEKADDTMYRRKSERQKALRANGKRDPE